MTPDILHYADRLTVGTQYEWSEVSGGGYRGQISVNGLVVWSSKKYSQDYQALEAAEEHYVESMRRLFHE